MPFRYDEAADAMRNSVIRRETHGFSPEDREKTVELIDALIEQYGPIVESYPDWHPLRKFDLGPLMHESRAIDAEVRKVYYDHPLRFRDAMLLAPYNKPPLEPLRAECERHDMLVHETSGLYHHKWCKLFVIIAPCSLCADGEKYIPQQGAVAAFIESLPHILGKHTPLTAAKCWESWSTMHHTLLGSPCGTRSSLLVDEKTGQAIKRLFVVTGQSLGLKEYGRV